MRLTDLNPRWVGAGGEGISRIDLITKERSPSPERHGVGVSFSCPCGCADECTIEFDVALDGQPWRTDDHGWKRTGDTFETLTLEPSIQRVGGCGWHGFITKGEVRKA